MHDPTHDTAADTATTDTATDTTSIGTTAIGTGPAGKNPTSVEDVDVYELASRPAPPAGWWMVITAVDIPDDPDEEPLFEAALHDPGTEPFGGDVMAHVRPISPVADTGAPGPWPVKASVYAVLDEGVVPVATWTYLEPTAWPQALAPTAAFAMRLVDNLARRPDPYTRHRVPTAVTTTRAPAV